MEARDGARTPHYPGLNKAMTVREVSAYLRVHPSTIYRLLKQREIPAFRVGSSWRFNVEQIDSWFSQQHNPHRARRIAANNFPANSEAPLSIRTGHRPLRQNGSERLRAGMS
jgi:excisionase family DNA binding protein